MAAFARSLVRCLAAAAAIWSAAPQAPAQTVVERPTQFPTKGGLDKKWDEFKGKPPTADSLGAILREDPTGSLLVRWGDARYASLWSAADRKAAESNDLDVIREGQESQAKTLARKIDDVDRLMSAFRKLPWAPSMQEALLRIGGQELRRGNVHVAARCFRDVLQRSANPELREHAQVALWVIAAHDPNPAALASAFQAVAAKAKFSWLSERLSAAEIRARLERKPAGRVVELGVMDKKLLDVPASAAAFDRPTIGGGIALAGPNNLTWFDGTSQKPTWSQSNPNVGGRESLAVLLPDPYRPEVAAGKIFARWNEQTLTMQVKVEPRSGQPPVVNSTIALPVNVVAFDQRTGVQAWSTANNPDWKDLCPINDPVFADDRLFVMTASRTQEYSPIYLTCLSAEDGSVLWKRELATCQTTSPGSPRRIDLIHSGSSVTVSGGSIYCATNAGFVACCDVRDGAIEWARTYPRDVAAGSSRVGSAPIVVGQQVVFLPRDAAIAFAARPLTGELAWLEAGNTQFAVGAHEDFVVLAGGRTLSAIDAATGKSKWERPFPENVEGRAMLSGDAVIAATNSKLYRVDVRSGTVLEEADWANAGTSLAALGKTLFAIVPSARPAPRPDIAKERPTRPSIPSPTIPLQFGSAGRVVHRHPQALTIDGQPLEWTGFETQPFEAAKGKTLISHDDKNLYIGVTAAGLDAATSRVEMTIVAGKKSGHWFVDGKGTWDGDGVDVPVGAKAAAANGADGTTIFEIVLPLEAILPPRTAHDSAWGRAGLELTVARADAKAAPFRVTEALYLHRLTREQESAGLHLADALPHSDRAWAFREQAWRARLPQASTAADLYKNYVKSQPKSADVGDALIRLDRALRKSIESDPKDDVLRFAEEVGVAEAPRAYYKKAAEAYVSQWVFVEDKYKPQLLEFQFFDGESSAYRIAAGDLAAKGRAEIDPSAPRPTGGTKTMTINGRTRMWIGGVEVDPATRLPLGAKKADPNPIKDDTRRALAAPFPTPGLWHEFRVPLLALGLHERPIQGMAFKQVGGSKVSWDRTSVVVDGKVVSTFGDSLADGQRLGPWEWSSEPVKAEKKSHATPPPPFKSDVVRHSATFKKGSTDHVFAAPTAPNDTIAAQLPHLAYDSFAAALFREAAKTAAPEARKELRQAILKNADRGDVGKWLAVFVQNEAEAGAADPRKAVEPAIAASGLPESVLAQFRDGGRFVARDWQVLAPLPSSSAASERDLALESDEIRLDLEHAGLSGKASWKPMQSKTARIDLAPLFGKVSTGAAYATCWINSDAKQTVTLAATSDDSFRVWIKSKGNFREAIDEPFFRGGAVSRSVTVELAPGWNQLLVRLDSRSGRWAFSLELQGRDGAILDGIQFQGTPGQD